MFHLITVVDIEGLTETLKIAGSQQKFSAEDGLAASQSQTWSYLITDSAAEGGKQSAQKHTYQPHTYSEQSEGTATSSPYVLFDVRPYKTANVSPSPTPHDATPPPSQHKSSCTFANTKLDTIQPTKADTQPLSQRRSDNTFATTKLNTIQPNKAVAQTSEQSSASRQVIPESIKKEKSHTAAEDRHVSRSPQPAADMKQQQLVIEDSAQLPPTGGQTLLSEEVNYQSASHTQDEKRDEDTDTADAVTPSSVLNAATTGRLSYRYPLSHACRDIICIKISPLKILEDSIISSIYLHVKNMGWVQNSSFPIVSS